jgi:acyl-CoA thioester hydrolase
MPSERPAAAAYKYFTPITARWMDNDIYGHINNVAYYSYFDSAANLYLIREGGLDIHGGDKLGLVVESHCAYHAPLSYPATLRAGLRVDKLGTRSVTYGIAIFAEGEDLAAAHGHFVHVFVDRVTRRPVDISPAIRTALEHIRSNP